MTDELKTIPTRYYKYGTSNMAKSDGSGTYSLSRRKTVRQIIVENEWVSDSRVYIALSGLADWDKVDELPDLAAAKAWYEEVTGGKPWVP